MCLLNCLGFYGCTFYYDPEGFGDTSQIIFPRVCHVLVLDSNSPRSRLDNRGGDAIEPRHFGPDGAPLSQIRREVLEEGLLLEVREHLLHNLANVDESKTIGWMLE